MGDGIGGGIGGSVGAGVGSGVVGLWVGAPLGRRDGSEDGEPVGSLDGVSFGFSLGKVVEGGLLCGSDGRDVGLADGSKHVLSTRRQLLHHSSSFNVSMKAWHPIVGATVGAEVTAGDRNDIGERLGIFSSFLVDIWKGVTIGLCFSKGLKSLWRNNVSSS